MSEHRKTPDWEWLRLLLEEYDITEKRSQVKNAKDFTSLEARIYSQIQKRYKPRKQPHYIQKNLGLTSDEYRQSMHTHVNEIETMRKMGYGLLLDGDTFYKIGCELEPYSGITFDMRQAYEIHRFIGELLEANFQGRKNESP